MIAWSDSSIYAELISDSQLNLKKVRKAARRKGEDYSLDKAREEGEVHVARGCGLYSADALEYWLLQPCR